MSSGHFTRTNRNMPQRSLIKAEQPTEVGSMSLQHNTVQEPNKDEYVYKPPSRIIRSNLNPVKQMAKVEEKLQIKKEESQKSTLTNKIQNPAQKTISFTRKPVTQTIKQTNLLRTTTILTQASEVTEEVKPQVSKTFYGRTKPTVEHKPQVKTSTSPIPKNTSEYLNQDSKNVKSIPNLEMKKPSSFYSYPKKITKRDCEIVPEVQVQKKPETTNSFQELKPQTPKFIKQETGQTSQSPQIFSSTYTSNAKNMNSQISGGQNNQSGNNLKQSPYKSVIETPVQKPYESNKPASTIVDSPTESLTKSPLSQVPRYINKVAETSTKEQKSVEFQRQIFKPPAKRSPLLVLALHRLYIQKFNTHLHQLFEYARNLKQAKSNQKLHQYFERSLHKFIKGYEQNVLMRNSFGLIKSIFSKLVKNDMAKSTDQKLVNLLAVSRNQCFGKVLQNIIPSNIMEIKASFLKIKFILRSEKIRQNKIETGAKILSGIEFKKMKENWQLLCEWANIRCQIKSFKLSKISDINHKYRKWLLRQAWTKLALNKLKELSSDVKTNQIKQASKSSPTKAPETILSETDQTQTNKQLKQKISDLQTKLSEVQQKASKIPKQSDLRKNIQQLKEEKQKITEQISVKKQYNSELNQKIQSLISKVSHESLPSLSEAKPQNQDSTLSLLHEIYMKTFKQAEHECISEENIASLYSIHRVEQNSIERQIVAKWLAVQENMTLKHWINLYEGNYVDEASGEGLIGQRKEAYKQIEEENEIIKKFIRSYIKERYMWQEVKSYVAAVITE